jgi:hypothetical protein
MIVKLLFELIILAQIFKGKQENIYLVEAKILQPLINIFNWL